MQTDFNDNVPTKDFPLASFDKRIAAYLLDLYIVFSSLYIFWFIIFYLDKFIFFISDKIGMYFSIIDILDKIGLGIPFLLPILWIVGYYIYFLMRTGRTPAKKLFGIAVIRCDGSLLTFWFALGRSIFYLISPIVFIGFILAIFDKRRQTIHDKIADSIVIEIGPTGKNIKYLSYIMIVLSVVCWYYFEFLLKIGRFLLPK